MSNNRVILIGMEGDTATGSVITQQQITDVESLDCNLEYKNRAVNWSDVDNPDEPRSLFQLIIHDRQKRIDQHMMMADRPPIAVVTARGDQAIRLEFYEGHDALECTYDLRSPDLEGLDLPRWMETDRNGYDPAAFLEQNFGISAAVMKPFLDALHETTGDAKKKSKLFDDAESEDENDEYDE